VSAHPAATLVGLLVLCLFLAPGPDVFGAGRPNVLLVTLDTTRADHIGSYGYDRDTSPAIDAVAADAALFSQAYSVIPLTTPAHVSIMTGLHPLKHGIYRNSQFIPEELVTLAELLDGRGYDTGAFVSAIVLSGRSRIDDGFDVYSDVPESPRGAPGEPRSRMREADETVDSALGWLSRHHEQPFFLWVHLYEPHLPYIPPDAYGRRFDPAFDAYKMTIEERLKSGEIPGPGPQDRELPPQLRRRGMGFPRALPPAEVAGMRHAYDGEIAYADAQLSRVLDFLKREQLYENTVVVVMGDHGEMLYEKRQYFGHHHFMYEGSLKVPLILRFPGVAARRIDQRITIVDVLPTLLDALEIENASPMDGTSFWPLIREGKQVDGRPYEVLVSHSRRSGPGPGPGPGPGSPDGAIFDPAAALKDRWKLVMTSPGDQPQATFELYDLRSDPGELKNLYDAERETPIVRELRELLSSALEATQGRIRHEPLDAATEERLRSLGYLP